MSVAVASSRAKPAPLLVLGIGNPSRGDDALGPLFVDRVSAALEGEIAEGAVELLTDFQLQIEHALDLEGRARVVFVDASVRASAPFELTRVHARRAPSAYTHAMSPEAVLDACRDVGGAPPDSWVLAIRGERFELGAPLSAEAEGHLDAAVAYFVAEARREISGAEASAVARALDIEGVVQGVGFRPWVARVASGLGLTGEVRNTRRGVRIEAAGPPRALDALVRAVQERPPAAARVRAVRVTSLPSAPRGRAFVIAPSDAEGPAAMVLPPDLATCDACLRDVDATGDRRHGYAFTSCTDCGPRLSIARALPYDRGRTTMAEIPLCDACRRENEDAADRRFHAQTNACAACGPSAWLEDPRGRRLDTTDAIASAASLLCGGAILAVQGLGAFHLVCDATDARAVAELRRRKRRDAQPFAVMVRDVDAARALVDLDDALHGALVSPSRPIVLAPKRSSALAREVDGESARTGVMLPYTALHHLLVSRVDRPLVVTSGNASGLPAVIAHGEARSALARVADALLLHDRPIARRVEDSVVARSCAGTRVLRRARGFAPLPIRLPAEATEPILAVGGHMKNAACLVTGDLAFLTPHLGDLELAESEDAWREEVEAFERLLGVRAQVLAHDLHPDYATTRYALARPARRRVGVQHHVAHVLAAVAEVHADEPVVGVVLDGTGWGTDGTSWGTEVLVVDGLRWTRAAAARPLPLPGGERGIREVWRAALGALADGFGAEEALALTGRLRVFDHVPRAQVAGALRMIEAGAATTSVRGMGRFFDAVGALALGSPRARFDGDVAIALERAAHASSLESYPFGAPRAIAAGDALAPESEIDLRPTLRAVVSALLGGAAAEIVAARFHATVIEAVASAAALTLEATGLRRVVLAGGCLQNHLLERGLVARLGRERVLMAREVPINDGGLALGQAWAAALAARGG